MDWIFEVANSFDNYLLRVHHVSGATLDAENLAVNIDKEKRHALNKYYIKLINYIHDMC